MARGYPHLIYFANRLQARMRARSLGEEFYVKIQERQQRARSFEEYKRRHDGVSYYPNQQILPYPDPL